MPVHSYERAGLSPLMGLGLLTATKPTVENGGLLSDIPYGTEFLFPARRAVENSQRFIAGLYEGLNDKSRQGRKHPMITLFKI